MRSKLFTLCILAVAISIAIMGLPKRSIYNSSAYGLQSQSARVIEHIDRARLETGLFKAIKIIKEHNVDAENFPVGFKIEFENTSNKPIYHLSAQAVIPQTGWGFKLLYGRGRLVDLDQRPIETEIPVRPGETAFLTIPEKQDKVGDILRAQGSGDKLNKILIAWQCLNYGDGTGFISSEPEDRSNRKIGMQQSKRDLDGLPFLFQ